VNQVQRQPGFRGTGLERNLQLLKQNVGGRFRFELWPVSEKMIVAKKIMYYYALGDARRIFAFLE